MEPNITLIWFVQPQWFQKMGAFARRENIPVFVDWCETAFKLFGESSTELSSRHTWWISPYPGSQSMLSSRVQ